MWNPIAGGGGKPESEELLPEFMQEALDALRALAIYFGLPALTAFFLLRDSGAPFRSMWRYYALVLTILFKRQHVFYLLQLAPALLARYALAKRFRRSWALAASVSLNVMAFLVLFPFAPFPGFDTLKDIAIYLSVCPCLMTYFTLRINRVRLSGASVLAVFLGLLCWGFLVGRKLP